MILSAFPTISEDGGNYTPENLEERTLKWQYIMNKHLAMNVESKHRYSMITLMKQQPTSMGYLS